MKFTKYTVLLLLCGLLLLAAERTWRVAQYSETRILLMDDYAEANSLENGLLSADHWKEKIVSIITYQIQNFELTQEQDSLLREEVAELLHKMIDEAEQQINAPKKGLKNRLRRVVINVLVDWDEVRKQVPSFTETIIREVTSDESKARLQQLAISKINELSDQIHSDTTAGQLSTILNEHDVGSIAALNSRIDTKARQLEAAAFTNTYLVLLLILGFLLPWPFVLRRRLISWKRPLFLVSLFMALVLLLGGLFLPMIEIDARIAEVSFTLMNEQVSFEDQMLFYRSKSIVEVVQTLLQTNKLDSIFVGFLIFLFSVMLPMAKLLATQAYVLKAERFRESKVVHWLVFYSGKWSMADVMVVAIFMAFIGFNGILDSQLAVVSVEDDGFQSFATNLTSLQPGFLFFLAFVLYSLLLSHLLKSGSLGG